MKLHFKKQKKVEVFERRRSGGDEAAPKVFSYYARGNTTPNNQNTGRNESQTSFKQQGSYKKLVYLPSYIALVMLLVAGLYACWLQPNPRIVIINKEGTITRATQEYQNGIESIWRRSLLNQTKLTVHGEAIRTEILAQYSELADVQLVLPLLGRRPSVIVTPSQPALQFVSTNGAFYVDSKGKVMARSTEVTQNQLTNIPVIRDETRLPAEVGKNIISESQAKYLQLLAAQLNQENISAESITLPSNAANEADIHLTGQVYTVKFSMMTEPRQAVGAFLTVKTKLENDHINPKEYIDVRVEEKVFYK